MPAYDIQSIFNRRRLVKPGVVLQLTVKLFPDPGINRTRRVADLSAGHFPYRDQLGTGTRQETLVCSVGGIGS